MAGTEPAEQGWGSIPTLSAQVPVATITPLPTAVWLVELVKVQVPVYLNHQAVETGDVTPVEETDLWKKVIDLETKLNNAIQQTRNHLGNSETVGDVPVAAEEGSPPVDMQAFGAELQQFVMEMDVKINETLHIEEPPPTAADGTPLKKPKPGNIQAYKDLFKLLPLPEVAQDYDTDKRFAKYRIAGHNIMLLKGVTKDEVDAMTGFRIKDETLNAILGTSGDSLERAGREDRLCVLDFRDLSGIDPVVEFNSFVVNPIAVFAEPVSMDGDTVIKPIAIQLGQDPVQSEIIFANAEDIVRWKMAKLVVQVADLTYHQMVNHLGHTHLMMEAFSVATLRNLPKEHPIARLLLPHTDGTISINRAAGVNLMGAKGYIADTFCNDRAPRVRSFQQLAVYGRLTFDFQRQMPDVHLKARKVDKLKVFPYRDDAILIWNAILRWIEDYVDLYYEKDDDVSKDEKLMEWFDDLIDNAHIRNFTKVTEKRALIRVLSMIIFIGSAQHSACNTPQQTEMPFAPAATGAIWEQMPDPEKGLATEEQLLQMLPPLSDAREFTNLVSALGPARYRILGEYHSTEFPFFGTLEKKVEPAFVSFKEELAAIETIIKARNKQRGYYHYQYLLPSKIAASVNI